MMETKRAYHHGDLKNALIQAGIAILAEEGLAGLSLRKTARRAGVSHSAPYAHFTDKQSLVAAISTESFSQLFDRMEAVFQSCYEQPARLLVESAWAYCQFALDDPARFKIMFSGTFDLTPNYPAFDEISSRAYGLLVEITHIGQSNSLLKMATPQVIANSLWSLTHGYTCLVLERQIPGQSQDRGSIRAMLVDILNQLTVVPLPEDLKSN
jgi:AcrR family transcriptional regulator